MKNIYHISVIMHSLMQTHIDSAEKHSGI